MQKKSVIIWYRITLFKFKFANITGIRNRDSKLIWGCFGLLDVMDRLVVSLVNSMHLNLSLEFSHC